MTDKLSTDLNVSPYFDDFDEDKGFHRHLFRPSFAVQARELTQIQSLLQDQIGKFGEHIFKEGTIVRGCELSYDGQYQFVKLRDRNADNDLITVSSFANVTLTGQTSGVTARVVNFQSGSEAENPDTNVLFVKYTSSGSNNTTQSFVSGEQLNANTGISANVFNSGTVTGNGSAITVNTGIIFVKDFFVKVPKQTLILDKFSDNPSYRVGYVFNESIITSTDDSSLLDNATGSPNENAPGANRLKISGVLTKKAISGDDLTNFYELYQIENGSFKVRGDRTQYAELRKEFARRTYDESGDYTVSPMIVRVRENLNDGTNLGYLTLAQGGDKDKLSIGVEPGKAFVRGYEYETLSTNWITVDKGTDTKEVEAQSIPANYGNYIPVEEVVGPWNLDDLSTVSLRNQRTRAISNGTFGTATAAGGEIGTAKIRALPYISGTPGTANGQFNAYLFDIKMNSGESFSNTRSLFVNNVSGSDAFADVVTTANSISLSETSFNRLVFNIPQDAIKNLRDASGNIDNNFQFMKEFNVTIDTNGQFTLSTGESDEVYPFSTGALNQTQKRDNFYLTLNADADSTLTGQANTTSNTVNGFSTSFNTELVTGDYIKIGGAGPYKVHSIADANTLTVTSSPGVLATNTITKFLASGSTIDLGGSGAQGSRTVTISTTTSAAVDIQENLDSTVSAQVRVNLQKTDGREIAKIYKPDRYVRIYANTHVANTVGPWGLGVSDVFALTEVRRKTSAFSNTSQGVDVTSNFELDTGQRDNFYEHGRIKKKPTSSLTIANNDVLLVKFSYFTHDTSQGDGYLSVGSYPIDDANTANTSAITTREIPIFTSPVTGNRYDLRNSVDLRPIRTNTANDTISLTNISTNPANSSAWTIASGGQHLIPPNESLTTDLEYYLPRKDKVVIDVDGNFKIVKGVPNIIPKEPGDIDDAMTLAIAEIPPYPSLAPNVGRSVNRIDLTTSIRQIDNQRYTMRDIGSLEQRINNLEYYVSLSLLEKDASELDILDDNGLSRFKNGIIVDAFTGHNVGDITNEDFAASIDPREQSLRPKFELNNVGLEYNSGSTNVYRSANDVTLSISSVAGSFSNSEVVYQGGTLGGASARGNLIFVANNARMYIEQTQGTFSTSLKIKGNSSSANADVGSITTTTDGNLATLPYTHSQFINQPFASKARNAVSELIFNWVGKITLSPNNDQWVDTVQQPDVQINWDGNADAWEQLADAWGTQWGDWETIWTGSSTSTDTSNRTVRQGNRIVQQTTTTNTTTTDERQTRTGTQINVTPETITQRIGPRVVDMSIVPFMRSVNIQVTGEILKPDTRVYAFFDGEDVSSYMTPANSTFGNTGVEGANLITSSTGTVYANFRLPNDTNLKFRTGTKRFRLTDSPTNSNTNVRTAASSEYTAFGIIQTTQDTVISTQRVDVDINTLNDVRDVQSTSVTSSSGSRVIGEVDNNDDGGDTDPITQSFYVSNRGGLYVSKLDLYFRTKSDTYPILVEIREMINGLPGPKIVPFSRKSVAAADVNVSSDASLPTPFIFDSPVYLKNEQEYCFVVKPAGNNPDYEVWVSELGQFDVTNTSQRISKQPATGVLFTSANDRTWTAAQNEDMKFTLYRANFDTNATGTILLTSKPSEFISVANQSGTFTVTENVHGEPRLTLSVTGSANVGEVVVGNISGANGEITDISGSVYRVKNVPTSTKFQTGESVRFIFTNGSNTGANGSISSQSTTSGKMIYYNGNISSNVKVHLESTNGSFANGEQITGQDSSATALISSITDLQLNTIHPIIQSLELNNTDLTWGVKTTTLSNTLDSTFETINDNEDFNFSSEKKLLGRTGEIASLSSDSTLQLQGTLSSSRSTLSPAVDLTRTGAIIVGNLINNNTTGETGEGGSANARYITRRVTLADGQDAEDLKVYLTAYKPSVTGIKVYYRIINAADDDLFTDRSWVEMDQVTSSTIISDSEYPLDFKEYEYKIPTANLTGPSGEVQYTNSSGATLTGFKTFAIKIVMTSTDTSLVPRIKDLRAIALAV